MSLRDLTKHYHQEAERQEFVSVLMSGKINPNLYATYLWNQYFRYDALEKIATTHGLLRGYYDGICRAPHIYNDFRSLWSYGGPPALTLGTEKYVHHIMWEIARTPESLMAHIYVNHMGDMSGGQMISPRVPGSKTMYKFEDAESYKEYIRSKINDEMLPEAAYAFRAATKLFQDMMSLNIERTVE